MGALVRQFFDFDWTPKIDILLRDALDAAVSGRGPRVRHLEFNVFEVTIDTERGLVRLQDVTDVSLAGEEALSIQAFFDALQRFSQAHQKS
jgi:hypothetical protein